MGAQTGYFVRGSFALFPAGAGASMLLPMKPKAGLAISSVVAVLALMLGSCAGPALRIEPVHKSATIAPKFDQSYYRVDRDGTLYFVLHSTTEDAASHGQIEQIVTARIFWQPIGGRTSLNPRSLNTTFRYLVMRPEGVGMYEGAGFVRLSDKAGAKHMTVRVMDADLRLTQATANFHDTIGRARLAGRISATYSDFETMDQILQAHQAFFGKSFHLADQVAGRPGKSTTGPTTEPTSRPAAD
jgi:hypothetical protein